MLQIRLSKGASADTGVAPAAKSSAVEETVTVACPDHLVLADLPVAKCLGAVTSSAGSATKSVGRRSRRQAGEKVHFCVRCDFPIAIYGRLVPCEHAFCLACARADSSCFICDERIQKIQTIKLMEGIFLCAAPHCLRSFLKRPDFITHLNESHSDLLQTNQEKEATNDPKPSSADSQKQSALPEISTARAPPRPGLSPTSSSQHEDRNRHQQSRDLPPSTPSHQEPGPPGFWFPQTPNYQMPMNPNPAMVQTQYGYVSTEQVSVMGVQPVATVEGLPRPWVGGMMGVPFQAMPMGQDTQGGVTFYQTDYGTVSAEPATAAAGMLTQQQIGQGGDVQGYSWQSDKQQHGPN